MAIFNPSHFARRPHEQPTAAASGHDLPPTYEESQGEDAVNGLRHEVIVNVRFHFEDCTGQRRLWGGTLPDRDSIHSLVLISFAVMVCYYIVRTV